MPRFSILFLLFSALSFPGLVSGEEFPPEVHAQIRAIQADKAARSPAERKLESQLQYLAREANGLPAVAGAPQLTSRVALAANGQVIVEISAVPSPELRAAIVAAGGSVIYESVRFNSVRASLPPTSLAVLALRADVKRIAKGTSPKAHTVTNESDFAEKAHVARPQFGVSGAGVKVGVISNSDDHSEASVAAGELPSFSVLPGRDGRPASGEGTAMSEIVHDIAPGADIVFATAGPGKPGFADSILLLQEAGCKIIVDDISYGNEWQFQDDEIGIAINTVVGTKNALYLSSSGNEGNKKNNNSTTWEGDFVDGGANALLPGGTVHQFAAGKNYNTLLSGKSGANLQWSDEYHTSANDYDLFVLNAAGTAIVASGNDKQDGTGAPMESVENVLPKERIVIWKAAAAAPRYLRLSCTGGPLAVATAGQTIGHAATKNCMCVASSDASLVAPGPFTTASLCDKASSDGPHSMFYNPDGTAITPNNFLAATGGGVVLQTPSITAGDGGQTSVPGFKPFYGTSAAAPAAAAIAALVWERNSALTNAQVRTVLEQSCLDIEDAGFDINSGNGILMASLALANASPTEPEIDLEQPALTQIKDGASRSFGSVAVNASSDLVFTIRNVGNGSLTGLGVTLVGPDAGEFSIFANPTAPLAGPEGSTTFTVRFSPTSMGLKTATVHLTSNDADEATFDIALSGLAPDPASIGRDDVVVATGGPTRLNPLANDRRTGDALFLMSVSDPAIVIQGRSLIIPAGYVGSFIYTVSDGTTTGQATVQVLAGTPIAKPSLWSGLLYESSGNIGGAVIASRNRLGTVSGTLQVGLSRVAFLVPHFSTSATRNTLLGSLTLTEESSGQLTVSLESDLPYTGSLRPGKISSAREQLNIAFTPTEISDPAISGGGYAIARVTALGLVSVAGKLPDGRTFTGASRVADNGSFIVYAPVGGTHPAAVIAGEFAQGDLPATDVTGELQWRLPAQKSGLQRGGVNTTLSGNGSLFTSGVLPPDGPGTLTLSGGDLAATSATATVVTAGKPTLPALVRSWTVNPVAGTFSAVIKDPNRKTAVSGTGVYLPKGGTAWGFFPGTTVGGSILLGP